MKTFRYMALFVLAASLLTACAIPPPVDPVPTDATPNGPTLPPQNGAQGPLPTAALLALAWIADVSGMPVQDVKVVSIQEMTWSDSCLGLGGPEESCLQAETPGFRIQALVGGRLYTVRTNTDGSAIRQVPVTGEAISPEEAGQTAVNFLAIHTGQPAGGIQVVNVEAIDWQDACLGVPIPNALCAQVITPGYRVSLSAGGQTYEVHTDLSASNIALADQP
jgi:hypothetical protein